MGSGHGPRIAVLVALLIGITSGCSNEPKSPDFPGSDTAMPSLPNETVSDLVSYADAIVVATVVDERDGATDVDPGDGSRYISRVLTFRVDNRAWSAKGAPQPGPEFELTTFGWNQRKDGSRKPSLRRDVIWYEKGQQYVIPLSRYEDGTIAIPSVDSIVPTSKSAVFGSGEPWTASSPGLAALAGKTPSELSATLAAAQVDPIASKYLDLNPSSRYRKVLAERSSTSSGS